MIVTKIDHAAGEYLTDGKRLVQVVRETENGLLVEEGDIEVADLGLIPTSELERWRVVTPDG